MTPRPETQLLYETDYYLWLNETVAQLKAGDFDNLDVENLIEEIESLGRSEKRALLSYLLRLCEHLLKLKYWETERQYCYRGWLLEISHFRLEIALILQDSPSLQPFANAAFLDSYQKARKNMLKAIGLSPDVIPKVPDFTIEEVLDEEWLPWQSDLNS
ncbi:MAG TPA: DUF29 domain-containing protein [Thermosynechococcus sp. M98_K2018_005]|uniref:DUF29 domain-containing protein n=1 Tax=Thermosynechococcus sp. M98_K2018_005 TaxID=2747811 RepID=UPI0019F22B25|nr:DUF29 domain-containing protein [Thermosynechococcus sp. M98_K2018_005]HIK35569.1 DUF29 domain-containing protein [Thermosynechococcus sp. M98_K2018_005]